MKRTDLLLWAILLLFLGGALWLLSTGKLDSLSRLFIDDLWNSLTNMVRSIFHR